MSNRARQTLFNSRYTRKAIYAELTLRVLDQFSTEQEIQPTKAFLLIRKTCLHSMLGEPQHHRTKDRLNRARVFWLNFSAIQAALDKFPIEMSPFIIDPRTTDFGIA